MAGGYIHIESPVIRAFTLGQFFDIWDQDLELDARGDGGGAPAREFCVGQRQTLERL